MISKNQNASIIPLTILVIDDETAIQKILTHYFKGKHTVVTCYNGQAALEWLYDGNLPDFIIADFNMPVVNGLDFLNEIKQSALFGHVPLIFLSGVDNSDTKIKCLEAGADDFIIKPFNPRELEARLSSVMRRIRTIQKV